jgi:hypothetical protein
MQMIDLKWSLLTAGAALALTGCAGSGLPGGSPQVIATVQPGDDQLSCTQLAAEMSRMDQIIASGGGSSMTGLTDAAATGASGMTGTLPQFGQTLANAASGITDALASNAAQQQATEVQMAQQRKQQLMNRYTQKKC